MTKDQTSVYRAALKEARAAFSAAEKRILELESETSVLKENVRNLRRTITALAALCSEDPRVDKLGITEVCMEAMSIIPHTASTADVVDWIEWWGFDISAQKNAEASVHAVLSRLAKDGKIEKITTSNGVRWRGPEYDKECDSEEIREMPTITDDDIPF